MPSSDPVYTLEDNPGKVFAPNLKKLIKIVNYFCILKHDDCDIT